MSNLPTRDSLNERKALKKVRLNEVEVNTLLRCLGYLEPSYRPKIQRAIIGEIEAELGKYEQLRISLDLQPRPTHIRQRARNIRDFSASLLKELEQADQITLNDILEAGYSEDRWRPASVITERIYVIETLLQNLIGSCDNVIEKYRAAGSQKRQTTYAQRVLVDQLQCIFDFRNKLPKIGHDRIRVAKKNKIKFIVTAAKSIGVYLPISWTRQLKSPD